MATPGDRVIVGVASVPSAVVSVGWVRVNRIHMHTQQTTTADATQRTLRGAVGAVGRAEGVVDVEVGVGGELLGELGVEFGS